MTKHLLPLRTDKWQYTNEPWYEQDHMFTDEWDQTSFDPAYDTLPWEHFVPMIDRVFSKELIKVAVQQA